MLRTLFCVLMVLVALVMAVLAVTLPRETLAPIIIISNFFEVMLPILAVGAIVNYIWKSNSCCCHHSSKEE